MQAFPLVFFCLRSSWKIKVSTEWPLEIKFLLFFIVLLLLFVLNIIVIITISWLLSVLASCLCINDLNELKED